MIQSLMPEAQSPLSMPPARLLGVWLAGLKDATPARTIFPIRNSPPTFRIIDAEAPAGNLDLQFNDTGQTLTHRLSDIAEEFIRPRDTVRREKDIIQITEAMR